MLDPGFFRWHLAAVGARDDIHQLALVRLSRLQVLAEIGGVELVGQARELAPGTFYKPALGQ